VSFITGFLSAVGRLWSKGCLGKSAVIFAALIVLGMCGSIFGGNRARPAQAPAAAITPSAPSPESTIVPAASPAPTIAAATLSPEVLASLATDAPTAELATIAPEPTSAPEPTAKPAAAPPVGAAPKGGDCPDDHPVKGNIVERGANKGEKIYHLPSSSSYKATKPERCFVDTKEAEAAGFRAPR
jgi:hypothetical protein